MKVIYKVPKNGSIPIKQDNAFKRLQQIPKQGYACNVFARLSGRLLTRYGAVPASHPVQSKSMRRWNQFSCHICFVHGGFILYILNHALCLHGSQVSAAMLVTTGRHHFFPRGNLRNNSLSFECLPTCGKRPEEATRCPWLIGVPAFVFSLTH